MFSGFRQAKRKHLFSKYKPYSTTSHEHVTCLSVPETETVVRHVFQNNLVSDKQWAYREGYSTELLLVHLSEIWRRAIDANNNNNNLYLYSLLLKNKLRQ